MQKSETNHLSTTWKYKIGGSRTSLILSFIMLIGFGCLAMWLHKAQNDAIIIGRIIVLFAAIAFLLALYRTIFFKFYIGKDGFFYQSRPGNGSYYSYHEIRKAWISSARETNAREMRYCHYETIDGKAVRVDFTNADVDAIKYFVKRVESTETVEHDNATEDNRVYEISGKAEGKPQVVVTAFISVIVFSLVYSLVQYDLPPVTYAISIFVGLYGIGYAILRYCYYKIRIESNGFFCQTNPFNGKYYRYCEIADCRVIKEIRKVGAGSHVRAGGVRTTNYVYYLIFSDNLGKRRKIMFDKALFDYEMNVLLSRAKQGQDGQKR